MIKVSLHNVRIAVIRGKMGRFPFSPKFRKFRLEIKWNGPFRFVPTGIFWITNFGQSDRNVPFHLTKLMCPVPLFCFLLTRTITKRAVAWVGSLQPEYNAPFEWARGTFEISNWKILLNGKRPWFITIYQCAYHQLQSIIGQAWSLYRFFPGLLGQYISGRIQDARTTWPETHRPHDRWKLKKKSLLTYKVSNTFMRLPSRVLQSRNLEPNFAQSRNSDSYFRNPVSPHSFNPESRPRFALKSRILSFK